MTLPKERPILFSAPMVRAILAGQKTVTRRAVKPYQQPELMEDGTWFAIAQKHRRYGFGVSGADADACAAALAASLFCHYGKPGDQLWVREAWSADAQVDSVPPRELSQGEPIWYPADGSTRQTGCSMLTRGKGRPSIHMPRWASRILLEITNVRVERLQAISVSQAEAEGIQFLRAVPDLDETMTPQQLFECLWDYVNGEDAWAANPWVWVVEFKRVKV